LEPGLRDRLKSSLVALPIEEAFVVFEVREVVTLTLEHTWDGRAVDMINAGKKKAAELAKQFCRGRANDRIRDAKLGRSDHDALQIRNRVFREAFIHQP
jgi:hypothetical protein